MKLVVLVLTCLAFYGQTFSKKHDLKTNIILKELLKRINTPSATVIINNYVDTVIDNINQYIQNHALEPLILEAAIYDEINYDDYVGLVYYDNGNVTNITSLRRTPESDASITYIKDELLLKIVLPLEYEALEINYNYTAGVVDINPNGNVTAIFSKPQFELDIDVDLNSLQIGLPYFGFYAYEELQFKYTGGSDLDWVITLLQDSFVRTFSSFGLSEVEYEFDKFLYSIIDAINSAIEEYLPPDSLPTDKKNIEKIARMLFKKNLLHQMA